MSKPYKILCQDTSRISRPEWLELRKPGIGSSDAAPSVNLSPWTSAYALWCEKRGITSNEEKEVERFWWGKALEPTILGRWADQLGHPTPQRNLMLQSTIHPHLLASPDGLIPGACVEVKTSDGWNQSKWRDFIPEHYVIQGLHQCIVVGVRRCYFPVLFGGNHLEEYVIDYKQDEVDALLEGEKEFWRRVVENDPPDPDGSYSSMMAIREQFLAFDKGSPIDLPSEAEDWIATRTQYEAMAKSAQATADAAKQKLMLAMGENELGLIDGEVAVTWKANVNNVRSLLIPKTRRPL